ncbi:hypothetical protein ACFOGJ_10985 [Marinibaculum pumilum]|uniref:Flagellar assembly protein FliH n=1 Tax=Marinibaculum pumilum TaxID=1766165 RepID=A0ABV7L009_9PROT
MANESGNTAPGTRRPPPDGPQVVAPGGKKAANVRKFTFGEQFDPSAEAVEAYRSPQRDETERRRQAEMAEVREQGYAAGHEAGLAEARAEINAAIAEALDRIGAGLAELGPSEQATGHMLTRQSIGIARAVGGQLAARLMESQPEAEVEALVADCIGQLRDEPQVVVSLAPEIAEAVQDRLQELATARGFAGKLIVKPEPGLQPTDARLVWSEGEAMRSESEVMQEIDAAVGRYLQGRGLAAAE